MSRDNYMPYSDYISSTVCIYQYIYLYSNHYIACHVTLVCGSVLFYSSYLTGVSSRHLGTKEEERLHMSGERESGELFRGAKPSLV